MEQKLQPGRKQCNGLEHYYSSANSAALKQVLHSFFVSFGRQFNPLCKSLNLCFAKGVLCAQILNHSKKNSWHLYIANLWEKLVIFRVPEVLLLPQDRYGMFCNCRNGETSGKAKLEQSVTRSAKLQL